MHTRYVPIQREQESMPYFDHFMRGHRHTGYVPHSTGTRIDAPNLSIHWEGHKHMALKRTTIFLDSNANRTLRTISKRTGLAPAQLTRLAIAQFIQREITEQKAKSVNA